MIDWVAAMPPPGVWRIRSRPFALSQTVNSHHEAVLVLVVNVSPQRWFRKKARVIGDDIPARTLVELHQVFSSDRAHRGVRQEHPARGFALYFLEYLTPVRH
jgi:hypothetical protein